MSFEILFATMDMLNVHLLAGLFAKIDLLIHSKKEKIVLKEVISKSSMISI